MRFDFDADQAIEKVKELGEDLSEKAADFLDSAKKTARTASYRGKDYWEKPTTKNKIERIEKGIVNFFEDVVEWFKNFILSRWD